MLRLNDHALILWREVDSLQIGLDGTVILDQVQRWQEAMLEHLRVGIPDAMWLPLARHEGAGAAEAEQLLATLAPVIAPAPAPPLTVRVMTPEDLSGVEQSDIHRALERAGAVLAAAERRDVPVILMARHLVEPRMTRELMSTDTVHVPVDIDGDIARVGPVVIPGSTACVMCLHAHRRDRDRLWPTVAVQALSRPATPWHPDLVDDAVRLALTLLRAVQREDPAVRGRRVTVQRYQARRQWSAHQPHAGCSCQSLEGIETPGVHDDRWIAPTTATGIARPA